MRIGSNLLNMALRVITPQTVQYSRFVSRETLANFQLVDTFADAVPVSGSFQPVPRASYQAMGLDFNKSYCKFYVSEAFQDIQRDKTGDKFVFGGATYQALSNTDWTNVDGWLGSLAVMVQS